MLLFFVCANLCCSRKSFHQQKENKEKMVVSFRAFTCSLHLLSFFFFEEEKKSYIAKSKKKKRYTGTQKTTYLLGVSPC